ncbi:MAG TPA: helix-turn-helix domain-containing protein [Solirubrobacteraceae bacterium]|nr:helix-turn-helix domain-containing protein [Solirubrobacteraceae bacterium]
MSPSASPPAAEWVLHGLTRRRDACVARVIGDTVATIEGYARLDADELADVTEHVAKGFDAIVRAIAERRELGEDDIPFLWPHIHRRAAAGVPEGDMLAVVRIFQRVLWDTILELAEERDEDRDAALTLTRPLLGYIDVLSDTVNKAYLEAGGAIASHAVQARAELLELLLAGTPPAPGATLNAARAVGLSTAAQQVLVVVGRPAAPGTDAAELPIAARLLARAAGHAVEPLAVARDGELVAVLPAPRAEPDGLVARIEAAHARLAKRGVRLSLGISTIHEGTGAVPAAYAEACLAVEQVRDGADVLALGSLDVHDYLILRAGDRTAWRLVPAAVRGFIAADAGQGSVLAETLLAYAACDLSVKLAGARLYVHPNTVHYRLAKIEAQTGLDVRRLRDVQLLTTAIRLHRGGHAS